MSIKNSNLAFASLLAGAVSLILNDMTLFVIPGLIMSLVALIRIRNNHEKDTNTKAFAIGGLIVNVLAILKIVIIVFKFY